MSRSISNETPNENEMYAMMFKEKEGERERDDADDHENFCLNWAIKQWPE